MLVHSVIVTVTKKLRSTLEVVSNVGSMLVIKVICIPITNVATTLTTISVAELI